MKQEFFHKQLTLSIYVYMFKIAAYTINTQLAFFLSKTELNSQSVTASSMAGQYQPMGEQN